MSAAARQVNVPSNQVSAVAVVVVIAVAAVASFAAAAVTVAVMVDPSTCRESRCTT